MWEIRDRVPPCPLPATEPRLPDILNVAQIFLIVETFLLIEREDDEMNGKPQMACVQRQNITAPGY